MKVCGLIQPDSWNRSDWDPLFDGFRPRLLQIDAALEGRTRASLYGDRFPRPRAAVLCVGVCWYGVGDPDRGFLREVNRRLPRDTYSVIIVSPDCVERWLPVLGEDLYFVSARSRYAERTTPQPIDLPLAAGYCAVPVDRALLESDLEGVDDLRESILNSWLTLEEYCECGFGFAVVRGSDVVARSLTDYVCGDRCEIGVATEEAHRLKGLGSHVAAATANEAFRRGLRRVGWMSWANNAGSIAVSEKAGFVESSAYDVYINHWPAENPENLTQAEFRAFAEEYERRFEDRPPSGSGYPHFVAATAWALAGDAARCRDQLHRAIDMDWLTRLDQLRRLWPELFDGGRVFGNPAWADLFARLDSGGEVPEGGGASR